MELFECAEYYVIASGTSTLWCSRVTGMLKVRPASSLETAWNPVCLGLVRGVIGKVQCWPGSPHYLVLVKSSTRIGSTMPTRAHQDAGESTKDDSTHCIHVHRVGRIGFVALATDVSCTEQFDLCPKHHFGMRRQDKIMMPTVFYPPPENDNALLNVGREIRGQFNKVITQFTHLPIGAEKQNSQSSGAGGGGNKQVDSPNWQGLKQPFNQSGASASPSMTPVGSQASGLGQSMGTESNFNVASNANSNTNANPRTSRVERRIQEELMRLFGEGHFYFAENARYHSYFSRLFAYITDGEQVDAPRNDFVFNYALLSEVFESYRTVLRLRATGQPPVTSTVSDAADSIELERLSTRELDALFEPFLFVVICGHVGLVELPIGRTDTPVSERRFSQTAGRLWLISRRLRRRNGVRYRRRGADPQSGACANCVETTQLLEFAYDLVHGPAESANGSCDDRSAGRWRSECIEYLAFRQLRGSVPICWSQSNTVRYHPPIRVDPNSALNSQAFRAHFEWLLTHYNPHRVVYISLIDQTFDEPLSANKPSNTSSSSALTSSASSMTRNDARSENAPTAASEKETTRSETDQQAGETQLADCFLRHAVALDDARLSFVAFNFHEYCRNGRYEHLALLLDELAPSVRELGFDWFRHGQFASQQDGVCRVNCVDCLDRTNVVQALLARLVLETQLRKLSVLRPEESLTGDCLARFQLVWADNGDAISQQYAGTASLKGDFTRTGERKLRGILQDGYYSAARYAQRFRDVLRQLAWSAACGELRQAPEFTAAIDRDTLGGGVDSGGSSPRKRAASVADAAALAAGLLTFRLRVLVPASLLATSRPSGSGSGSCREEDALRSIHNSDEHVRVEAASEDAVETQVRVTGAMVPSPLLRTLLATRPGATALPLSARLSVLFAKRDSMLLRVVERVKHALLASGELCFGAFPLVDLDVKRPTSQDVVLAHTFDALLFIARRCVYVVRDAAEAAHYGLPCCEQIPVSALERVELHVAQLPLPVASDTDADPDIDVDPTLSPVTPLVPDASVSVGYLRLYLSQSGTGAQSSALSLQRSYFHSFMHPRRRLFNHVLLGVSSEEEMREALKNCADTLQIVADMNAAEAGSRPVAASFITSFNRRKTGRSKSRTFACNDADWRFDFSGHSKLDAPTVDVAANRQPQRDSDEGAAVVPAQQNDEAESTDDDKSESDSSNELVVSDAELLDDGKKDGDVDSCSEADSLFIMRQSRDSEAVVVQMRSNSSLLSVRRQRSSSCENIRSTIDLTARASITRWGSAASQLDGDQSQRPLSLMEAADPAPDADGSQKGKPLENYEDSNKINSWLNRFKGKNSVNRKEESAGAKDSDAQKPPPVEGAFSFGKLKLKFGVPNSFGKKLFATPSSGSSSAAVPSKSEADIKRQLNSSEKASDADSAAAQMGSNEQRGSRTGAGSDRRATLIPNLAFVAANNFQNALTSVAKDVQSAMQAQMSTGSLSVGLQPTVPVSSPLAEKVRVTMKRNADENSRRFATQTQTRLLVFNKI